MLKCPYCGGRSFHRMDAFNRRCIVCGRSFNVQAADKLSRPPKIRNVHGQPIPEILSRNKYWVFNHQGKADKIIEALDTKYERSEHPNNYIQVKFCFTDYAVWGRTRMLGVMKKQGVERFFIYPHSARPNLINDVMAEWDNITAQFVTAPGHIDVMRTFGYPKPLHAVGWMLCPQKEFEPREQARNILFAPIHPRCDDVDKRANQKTFSILEKLAKQDKIHLTVRYISYLEGSGLEHVEHPNIEYVRGVMNNGYEQIDMADVVVASNTYAYKAVARGVPTVMMGEKSVPEHWLKTPTLFAQNWDKYVDIMAYPFDILDTSDPHRLLERVTKSEYGIKMWKKRMIGEPFCPEKFMEIVESYL